MKITEILQAAILGGSSLTVNAAPLDGRALSTEQKEKILIDSFSNSTLSTWSYYYTHGNHLAGNTTQYELNSIILTHLKAKTNHRPTGQLASLPSMASTAAKSLRTIPF